jgi:transcription initiation factor IIE alpha subunit
VNDSAPAVPSRGYSPFEKVTNTMLGNFKCPACEAEISQLEATPTVIGNQAFGPLYHAVVATCPRCRAVLGVLNDPDGMQRQLAKEMDSLRKDMGLPSRKR